jgi:hypothetical protein
MTKRKRKLVTKVSRKPPKPTKPYTLAGDRRCLKHKPAKNPKQ